MFDKKIRVLIAKPGLDGHDRGAKVVAQALRDAGMEVVYTGLRQTPEQIVSIAIQEDVDVIGLSSLSGAHNHLFPPVVQLLKEQGSEDVLVFGGGVIPNEDIAYLKEQGIAEIFTPGTPTTQIIAFLKRKFNLLAPELESIIKPIKIDHLGIAVKSIEEALKMYEGVLGLVCVKREIVADQKVEVAFLPIGESKVELLQSTSPDGPVAKYIEKNGEGIQHVAYLVEDLEGKLAELKAKGIKLIDEVPRLGAGGAKIAFVHPKGTFGTLIELCQRQGGEKRR
jgi:methylmalonyl-CoA mutase C-terminal domain/subunit